MRYWSFVLSVLIFANGSYAESAVENGQALPLSEVASPVQRQQPRYPGFDILYKIEGEATLLILVGTDGHPKDIKVQVSSGHRELDRAAMNAAINWTFVPERKGGVAVEGYVKVPVNFNWPEINTGASQQLPVISYTLDDTPIPYATVDEALEKVSQVAEYRPPNDSPDSALRAFGIISTKDKSREMWYFLDMHTDDAMVVRYVYVPTPNGLSARASALCKKGAEFCKRRLPWV